ncbi:response regulator [Leptospira alstonii]|uniref:PAS domain S-box protein n=2 Tax=Leptospira alstonii TaxID=28452 RepID=M6CWG2_9LEPT|nr:response regulator [Leptospira alstonii]EMJ96019.1 PAS domain S-box protein [Leptospira alstonii serovar Sichuan str. 79601]EQA79734.1 PAS domain S-box protein [Leptospira alstonii serovar Pingchang str. 80-412]
MSHCKILIVEDEQLVAKDIQIVLLNMGYDVPSIVSSGDEAMAVIPLLKPHLILMDIRLGSKPDGIELAAMIRSEFDLPVIYLTAFTDDDTLKRAQLTEPYGYVIKPFSARELQITIEIAIFKHKIERDLRQNRTWLSTILESIGDGVIATDVDGKIVFLNSVAEALTEWSRKDAHGRDLEAIFNVLMRKNFLSPWIQFSDRINLQTGYFHETILISKKGKEQSIHSTVSKLRDENGRLVGEVIVFSVVIARESPFLPVLR